MKKPASKWHSVTVVLNGSSCAAAALCRNTRYLSHEAPRLPLSACSHPNECRCVFRHHEDRRTGPVVADLRAMTGVDLQTENVAHLIQLALGPVFLISGVGITLSMLTTRLARIVDRARTLEDFREHAADAKRLAHIDEDLKYIVRRTRYINSAIALATTSALLTALLVTLLFASAFSPLTIGGVIAIIFVLSMVCLSLAFLMFLIEVRIATKSLRIGGKIRR